jgi:vacuolar-type H+-ATPase subunit H
VSRAHAGSPVVAPPPQGDLTRLLETERRLDERLSAARTAGETLVARAEADARRREAALEAELETEERRLDQTLAAERQARAAEIVENARRTAAAYEAVEPGRLAAVARHLAERFLVAGETAP